ncbi:unnamed protein product [Camellia sinensis]
MYFLNQPPLTREGVVDAGGLRKYSEEIKNKKKNLENYIFDEKMPYVSHMSIAISKFNIKLMEELHYNLT